MSQTDYVIQRWFAGQRAIVKFLPGDGRWAKDPIACLHETPVIIGRTFPAIQTTIISALVVGLLVWQGTLPANWTIALIGFSVLCAISLVPQLFLLQHQIVMTSGGLEVGKSSRHLFIPWRAFELPQTALISHWRAMSFAIRPGWADRIECREKGQIVARGVGANVFAARVLDERTLKIRGWYRAHPYELSEVILGVCESLEESQESIPQLPVATENKQRFVEGEHADFIEVRIPQLNLPECCSGCMNDSYKLRDLDSRGIFLAKQGLEIPVPICTRCWRRFSIQRIAAALCALFLVAVAATPLLLVIQPFERVIIIAILPACIAMIFAGIIAESKFSPCYIFRYNPKHETVRMRFRNEQYRKRVLASADS